MVQLHHWHECDCVITQLPVRGLEYTLTIGYSNVSIKWGLNYTEQLYTLVSIVTGLCGSSTIGRAKLDVRAFHTEWSAYMPNEMPVPFKFHILPFVAQPWWHHCDIIAIFFPPDLTKLPQRNISTYKNVYMGWAALLEMRTLIFMCKISDSSTWVHLVTFHCCSSLKHSLTPSLSLSYTHHTTLEMQLPRNQVMLSNKKFCPPLSVFSLSLISPPHSLCFFLPISLKLTIPWSPPPPLLSAALPLAPLPGKCRACYLSQGRH